jgi:hypothetical protein
LLTAASAVGELLVGRLIAAGLSSIALAGRLLIGAKPAHDADEEPAMTAEPDTITVDDLHVAGPMAVTLGTESNLAVFQELERIGTVTVLGTEDIDLDGGMNTISATP